MASESWNGGEDSARKPGKYVRWALVAVWVVSALATLQFRVTDRTEFHFTPHGANGRGSGELVLGRIGIKERAHSDLAVPGWQDRTARGKTIRQAAETAKRTVMDASGMRPLHFVTFGEPAIFFHLSAEGFDASPVQEFGFLAAGQPPLTQPAFVMAFSTDDFQKLIAPYLSRLELIALFRESPSDLVLLDSPQYPPSDLAAGGGRPREELRLYRIKSP
jgi:hypothetical protein